MEGLTKKQIIALAGFLIILISIPISFFLMKQTQIFGSKASEKKTNAEITSQITGTVTKPRPVPTNSPLTDLQNLIQGNSTTNQTPSGSDIIPNPGTTEQNPTTSIGPTLNLKVSIEARPVNKQSDKVFIGLSAGNATVSPKYILTFTVDIPDSGTYKGLSLAGLDPGSVYTAYIKGSSQIDSASTFTMSTTETNLNNDQPISLITGDLNEDNTINSADYTIARGYYRTTRASSNWNERVDFNKDGVINDFDLLYINKNMGKIGASGTWISTPKATTTPTASLNNQSNVGGAPSGFGDLLLVSSSSASNSSQSAEPTSSQSRSPYWIYVP